MYSDDDAVVDLKVFFLSVVSYLVQKCQYFFRKYALLSDEAHSPGSLDGSLSVL